MSDSRNEGFGRWVTERIAALRGEAEKKGEKLTYEDIADAVGVKRPTINNYMAGSVPSGDRVVPLAVALGVHVFEVLRALGTPPPKGAAPYNLGDIPEDDETPSGDGNPRHIKGGLVYRVRTADGRTILEHRLDTYQEGDPLETVIEGGEAL